jgi:hypothetical protein
MWQRSSFCSSGECVEVSAPWARSSFCGAGECLEVQFRAAARCVSEDCVEVGGCACGDTVYVRDSKLGEASPVLAFTPAEWTAFVQGARAGEFGLT